MTTAAVSHSLQFNDTMLDTAARDKVRSEVEAAFASIAEVHGAPGIHVGVRTVTDDELLRVRASNGSEVPAADFVKGVEGYYDRTRRGTLNLNPRALGHGSVGATVIHEFAHLLDTEFFGNGVLATEESPGSVGEVLVALFGTATLQRILHREPVSHAGDVIALDDAGASYLGSRSETFARAYMQHVATRTYNKSARYMLRTIADDNPFEFWAPAEFEPVSAAFDALFARYGLASGRTFQVATGGETREVSHVND